MAITDRYDLLGLLGQGSFGQVFRAVDRSRRSTVAIKVLHRQDDDALRRFHREAVVLHSQITNEHVVRLLDHTGLEDEDPYLVLEFCEFGSLRSWVRERRGWRQVATALLHAATGLAGVHAARGLHRDVKPENVLVARTASLPGWRVKVADFGVAGFPHPATGDMTLSAFGTTGYIAPELFGGTPFHPGADVYSLGIVGVELLVGRIEPAALEASGVPRSLIALIRSMVSGRPEARPTARSVAESLVALLAEANDAPASRPPAVTRAATVPASPGRSSNAGFWGVLAAAGAAIAFGTMNTKDANGRFRGSDGKFRSGRWG